jgi:MYXO-CTERM domain-containing protein
MHSCLRLGVDGIASAMKRTLFDIEEFLDLVDIDAWDSAGFAAALAERIIDPGLHAVDLIDTWPHLTRLHTTMSPHEMTVDPMFQPAPQLGDVSNSLVAQAIIPCDDDSALYLVPFGGAQLPVCVNGLGIWPEQLQAHPALRIEQIPPKGPPQVLEDFTATIVAEHANYLLSTDCANSGGDESADEGAPEEESGGGETGDASLSDRGSKAGCACRSDAPGSSSGAALGLLGLASLVGGWRRRRKH